MTYRATIPNRLRRLAACAALLVIAAPACTQSRERERPAPVYRGDIATLLAERCGPCHDRDADPDAGAGYRIDSYLHVLGCPSDMPTTPAIEAGDAGVALLSVFERSDHADLLSEVEQARLRAWIEDGAPLQAARVHEPGVLNPRSATWHGKLAARERFAPLRDPKDARACGRCHEGAPVRPRGVRVPAEGAPACTSCHTAPEGVLACGTCHGDGATRAEPPRDACLFATTGRDAHRAHLESTRLRAVPLECSNCHPAADATLSGTHANGRVNVALDPEVAGEDARFFEADGACAVSCHDLGGARARPTFDQAGPLACGDCHRSPPEGHYAGDCDDCHLDSNRDGSALRSTTLHMNGRIDVANGDADCSGCHGQGGDPMPRTQGHLLHRDTTLTADIACSECHVVPERIASEGHLDRGDATPADVVFGPRASAFGQTPTYDGHTCRQIACHGAGLPDGADRALRWDEAGAGGCAGCHGLPPGHDHPQDSACASASCHGAEIKVASPTPGITEGGRALHINGRVDLAPR